MESLVTAGVVGVVIGLIEIIKRLLPKGSALTRDEAFMLKGIYNQTKEVSNKDIQSMSEKVTEELRQISENGQKTALILERIERRQNGN